MEQDRAGGRGALTYLSAAITSAASEPHAVGEARRIASRLLLPPTLTGRIIKRYLERALRNGAWARLPREAKALLYAASKTVSRVRSPALREALSNIFLQVELAVARGKALLAATAHLLSKGLNPLNKPKEALIILGISIINHPLLAPG